MNTNLTLRILEIRLELNDLGSWISKITESFIAG